MFLRLNVEFISRVRQTFSYIHMCKARVKIIGGNADLREKNIALKALNFILLESFPLLFNILDCEKRTHL